MKLDKYALGRILAETSNSVTFAAEDTLSHSLVAVKVVNPPSCDLAHRLLQTEIDLMQRVKHPHVISLLDIIDVSGRKIIVTPLAHCTLENLIRSDRGHPERFVRSVMHQLLQALAYLHSTFIVHRDVKPANIYVMGENRSDPQIVLADFGCAADLRSHFASEIVGTAAFIAPEVYTGKNCMFTIN
jgi:serine/threonine protein kinase